MLLHFIDLTRSAIVHDVQAFVNFQKW